MIDNRADIVKLLVADERTDVNAQSVAGNTPLHNAFGHCNPAVVRALLVERIDLTLTNREGMTASQYADRPQVNAEARRILRQFVAERAVRNADLETARKGIGTFRSATWVTVLRIDKLTVRSAGAQMKTPSSIGKSDGGASTKIEEGESDWEDVEMGTPMRVALQACRHGNKGE